jgi:putative endonuclease
MSREHNYFVYMLASGLYGTLYIGVTNDLRRRVEEHRAGLGGVFTKRYKIHRLVWFEHVFDVAAAIRREKSMKDWPREWKTNLIERDNPNWDDLYPSLVSGI